MHKFIPLMMVTAGMLLAIGAAYFGQLTGI
jgi:hypothetical protein